MIVSPGGPKTVPQFYRQSTDETYGVWVDVRGCAYVTFYLSSNGTTSSGVITIEEAAPEDFTNWAPPSPPNIPWAVDKCAVVTTVNASTISGASQVPVHLSAAAYCFVRARISTAIGGGGTVSAGCVAY